MEGLVFVLIKILQWRLEPWFLGITFCYHLCNLATVDIMSRVAFLCKDNRGLAPADQRRKFALIQKQTRLLILAFPLELRVCCFLREHRLNSVRNYFSSSVFYFPWIAMRWGGCCKQFLISFWTTFRVSFELQFNLVWSIRWRDLSSWIFCNIYPTICDNCNSYYILHRIL